MVKDERKTGKYKEKNCYKYIFSFSFSFISAKASGVSRQLHNFRELIWALGLALITIKELRKISVAHQKFMPNLDFACQT